MAATINASKLILINPPTPELLHEGITDQESMSTTTILNTSQHCCVMGHWAAVLVFCFRQLLFGSKNQIVSKLLFIGICKQAYLKRPIS